MPVQRPRQECPPRRLVLPIGSPGLILQHLVHHLGRHPLRKLPDHRLAERGDADAEAPCEQCSRQPRRLRVPSFEVAQHMQSICGCEGRAAQQSPRLEARSPAPCQHTDARALDELSRLHRSIADPVEDFLFGGIEQAPGGTARGHKFNQVIIPARPGFGRQLSQHRNDFRVFAGQQAQRDRALGADQQLAIRANAHVAVTAQARRVDIHCLDHRAPATHARAVHVEHRPATLERGDIRGRPTDVHRPHVAATGQVPRAHDAGRRA